jgi:hypothetical protein
LNSAILAINGDVDVLDCSWEASTRESNWLSSLNSSESWRDSGKVWCLGRVECDGVGQNLFGSLEVNLREAVVSCGGAIDGLDAEEFDLSKIGSMVGICVPSILVILRLSSSIIEFNRVPA